MAALLACKTSEQRAQEQAARAAASAEVKVTPTETAAPEPRCLLTVPGGGAVLVFPTEAGMDEFSRAAATSDSEAMAVAKTANDGFFVAPETRCLWLDRGIMRTKFRITDGPHEGEIGWAPTEWTRGK